MTRIQPIVLGSVLLLAGAGACGGSDDTGTAPPTTAVPAVAVADAAGHDGELVVVEGTVLAAPEAPHRLCEALAESYPPQCGGARLEIVGLDLALLPPLDANEELPEGEQTRWSEHPVRLTGRVEGEALVLVAPSGDDLDESHVLVQALVGPAPATRVMIELWSDDGGVRSARTDDLGVVVFTVPDGALEVAALPFGDRPAPARQTVHGGDAVTVQYQR